MKVKFGFGARKANYSRCYSLAAIAWPAPPGKNQDEQACARLGPIQMRPSDEIEFGEL